MQVCAAVQIFALIACTGTAQPAAEPKLLSEVAGVFRCLGVPDLDTAAKWGCQVDSITDCSGKTTKKANAAILPPQAMKAACNGQNLKNATGQDGLPITFNYPVDMSTVKAEHFIWHFPDGTSRAAACAIPNGRPADEPNELQTIALVGNAGGWTSDNQVSSVEIVGDLMLIAPNGSKVSAKGLKYAGPSLKYANGPILLTADLEVFTTKGETLKNPPSPPGVNVFPNHCQVNFPETTHRIRLLFDGGVSIDSIKQITPDRTDLFDVLDESGQPIATSVYLGLADLGSAGIPKTQCQKDTYGTDGDNYVDICLKLDADGAMPAKVHLPCTADKQIANPKGSKYPCAAQTIQVTFNNFTEYGGEDYFLDAPAADPPSSAQPLEPSISALFTACLSAALAATACKWSRSQ